MMKRKAPNLAMRSGRFGLIAAFLSASLFTLACAGTCIANELAALRPLQSAYPQNNHCGDSAPSPAHSQPSHKNDCQSHGHAGAYLLIAAGVNVLANPELVSSLTTDVVVLLPNLTGTEASTTFFASHGPPGLFSQPANAFSILRI